MTDPRPDPREVIRQFICCGHNECSANPCCANQWEQAANDLIAMLAAAGYAIVPWGPTRGVVFHVMALEDYRATSSEVVKTAERERGDG